MGLYSAHYRSGALRTDEVTVFQLDEYLGLAAGDRRSLLGWTRRSFLESLGIRDEQVVPLPLPLDGDVGESCAAFDRAVEARGRLDIAILGLGRNGYLGLDEPPSASRSRTRVVELTADTLQDNARYWGSVADVPARAVTMALRQLLGARWIVMVVSGAIKRAIVHRALEGPVGPEVPASFLQMAEAEVTVIVDRAAWGDR
jgi:glucosamine-6-phosphate deaminase